VNDFPGIVTLQAGKLEQALRAHGEQRCRELRRDADRRAKTLLGDSRGKLLARGRQAVVEERQRRAAALQQARNRVQAEGDRRRQQLYAAILREGWPMLVRELQQRWSAASGRRPWCRKLLDEAVAALPQGGWSVEYPDDLSADDLRWLTGEFRALGIEDAAFRREPGCAAGLRIRRDTACLDGTIDGLLRQHECIEGQLLSAWEAVAPGAADA